jgi:ABC-type dipeptide/oligopeptide/nickel transport system permease component
VVLPGQGEAETHVREADGDRQVPWFVTFLLRRGAWAAITLFVYVSFLFFFIQWWVPFSGGGRAAALAAAREPQPSLVSRYWDFLADLVTGSLQVCTVGEDWQGQGVVDVCLADSLPVTLFIFVVGAVFAYLIGDYLGRVGAWRRRKYLSGSISVLGVLSATIFPPFLVFVLVWALTDPLYSLLRSLGLDFNNAPLWNEASFGQGTAFMYITAGLMLAVVAGVIVRGYARQRRRWVVAALALPFMFVALAIGLMFSGYSTYVLDVLFRYGHGVAVGSGTPVLALVGFVLVAFGQILFMMRVSVEDERAEDYVLTAWAKGLTRREIRDVHIARNAMAPTVAASFLTVPTILAGMVIVESEMDLNGLATQFFAALINKDVPAVMGILVILGILGVGLRLASDLVIAILDPRLRSGPT